jgi:hypothetical protein
VLKYQKGIPAPIHNKQTKQKTARHTWGIVWIDSGSEQHYPEQQFISYRKESQHYVSMAPQVHAKKV